MASPDGTLVRFELSGASYTVGRHTSCDILIDEPGVSRFMGEFKALPEGYVYYDHNSVNGSFLNDSRISRGGTRPLRDGDVIKLGRATVSFENPSGATPVTYRVRFARSDVEVHTGESTNLLDLAEEAGVDVDYACRMGSCLTCQVRVLKGDVHGEIELDDEKRSAGWILACTAYPRSDVVLDV